jgi:hypothetical protein
MLALPQEYIGSLCEIKSINNESLAVGSIIKIDNEALEVAAAEGDRMPLLQYRTPVKMFVNNLRLGTFILVGIAYLSTENFARIEEVKPLQEFERRRAFRVNTDVMGEMSLLMTETELAALSAEPAGPGGETHGEAAFSDIVAVRIVDISLTGLRLQTDSRLRPGARYYVEFKLLGKTTGLCLRVQRRIESPGGSLQYGGIFFDFSERQMDMLCKDLFQLQRMERQRRANSAAQL